MLDVLFFRMISFTSPHDPAALSGSEPPHYQGLAITLRRTTIGRTPLVRRSARSRDLYLTHTTVKTDINAHSGIRTRNPSKRAATDLSFFIH